MINQTAELAIKVMIRLAVNRDESPVSPHALADEMDCSPTYLAKVMGDLAKAGLIRSFRGVSGGFVIERPLKQITLLEIVEAAQGMLASNYCKAIGDEKGPVCAFHSAMWDVFMATRQAMNRWNLEKLAATPLPTGPLKNNKQCRMAFAAAECAASCSR